MKVFSLMMNNESRSDYGGHDYSHTDNQDIRFERSFPPALLWQFAGIGGALVGIAPLIFAFLHKNWGGNFAIKGGKMRIHRPVEIVSRIPKPSDFLGIRKRTLGLVRHANFGKV